MRAISGIYKIVTPNGSTYVGSSRDVRQRWSEHRSMLRRGVHHSVRLQKAFDRHGSNLVFEVIEECEASSFNEREQDYIKSLNAKLNTMQFIPNVWDNPEIVAKIKATRADPAWRKRRSQMSLARLHRACRAVVCSDGRRFEKMADAARAFGIRTAGILALAKTQQTGRLGVAFRFENEAWDGRKPGSRIGIRHSDATLVKLKTARHLRPLAPCQAAKNAAVAAVQQPVIGRCKMTGEERVYPSIKAAVAAIGVPHTATAQAQISKVCSGVKKHAYGYAWRKRA